MTKKEKTNLIQLIKLELKAKSSNEGIIKVATAFGFKKQTVKNYLKALSK